MGGSKIVGDAADQERMDFMTDEISAVCLRHRENTEAILMVGALMRVARILIRSYPRQLGQEFVLACIAYLEGRTQLPGAETENLSRLGFWMPPGSNSRH